MSIQCGELQLDLSVPVVMGILNVTPDSFSDGGEFSDVEKAVKHAHAMVASGAGIIDVGGESTRPGAKTVSVKEELGRVIPVIESLAKSVSVPISIDTVKPEVMSAAIAVGATIVNDVNALRAPGALEVVSESKVAVCLMHMIKTPETMQQSPQYDDVVLDVKEFLLQRVVACESAGISRDRMMLDPGFGFGKTLEHNVALFKSLSTLVDQGIPVLAGVSRKRMLGELTGLATEARMVPSVVAAIMAVQRGCKIVRVHDVEETVQALKICSALT